MVVDPLRLLRDAQKAVPATRYAAGLLGVAAVVAIVAGFQIDPRIAVFGTVIVLGLMFVLVVFGAIAAHASTALLPLALVAAWSFVLLAIVTSSLLMTSYFFEWPRTLTAYLPAVPEKDPVVLVDRSIHVDCPRPYSQECGKAFEARMDLPYDGLVTIHYQVPPEHCGPFQFELYIDEQKIGESGLLGWRTGPGPSFGPLEARFETALSQGSHSMRLLGSSDAGGCNHGAMSAFDGRLKVTLAPN